MDDRTAENSLSQCTCVFKQVREMQGCPLHGARSSKERVFVLDTHIWREPVLPLPNEDGSARPGRWYVPADETFAVCRVCDTQDYCTRQGACRIETVPTIAASGTYTGTREQFACTICRESVWAHRCPVKTNEQRAALDARLAGRPRRPVDPDDISRHLDETPTRQSDINTVLPLDLDAAREATRKVVSEELQAGMAMLPNDHHPGPRCSCRECLTRYPVSTDEQRSYCVECGADRIDKASVAEKSGPRAAQWTPEEIAKFKAENSPPMELPRIPPPRDDEPCGCVVGFGGSPVILCAKHKPVSEDAR